MHFFVLVPSDSPSGPVKGAYAIVNELANRNLTSISLVFLKSGPGANQPLDSRVSSHCLYMEKNGFFKALKQYKNLLRKDDGQSVVSLSMCFSADVVNSFVSGFARTYTSIRGNLFANYKRDYGAKGSFLALIHLIICRRFKTIFVLSASMKHQVSAFVPTEPVIQRNFIDEAAFESFRTMSKPKTGIRIGFLGSLSKRKRPLLLVDLLADLTQKGHDVCLDIVGHGPLKAELESSLLRRGLLNKCTIHGFVRKPFEVLYSCDVLVLPSESEGTSRAIMEALYLGIPCVSFNVDGMDEIIINGGNGVLVESVEELPGAVLEAQDLVTRHSDVPRPCLLPDQFRQETAITSLLEQIHE